MSRRTRLSQSAHSVGPAGICSSLHIARFWGLDEPDDGADEPPTRAELLEHLKALQEAVDGLRALIERLP